MLSTCKFSVPFSKDVALWHEPTSFSLLSKIPNTFRPINESAAFLQEELNVDVLDSLRNHMWLAGLSASHIRPLHRQIVVRRQIKICEQMGLHLVSHRDDMFIKPIPRSLLHHTFFEEYVSTDPRLHSAALGFLCTYLWLIRYESDFHIALEHKLLPSSTTWEDWLKFAEQVNAARPGRFGNRFDFGELKLIRLNMIARVFRGRIVHGYQTLETGYG
jgi:hypothetical protein